MDLEKTFVKNFIKNLDAAPFTVTFWDGDTVKIGNGDPLFHVNIKEHIKKTALLNSTSLALGEAYMDGIIEIDGDLYTALDSILASMDKFHTNFKAFPKIYHRSTGKSKQREDVSSHYDLGNDFYKLWLDDTLSYSCAYFKNENDSLYDAQMNKIHHILKKLNLKEGESLLDIGCGWGYLLIEAAKKYNINGLGITLSEEQYAQFNKRIKEEGLEDKLRVKLMDYRDLEKSSLEFDKIVSVGMLEHVGRDHYDLYMKNANAVLKKGGLFLLHYISGQNETNGDAWIKKYIFPGGMIPSLREIINLSPKYDFRVIDIESLRLHYMETLLRWGKNFDRSIGTIQEMFDERFIRMWRLYLYSCAAGFHNGVVDLHQILFSKGVNNSLPLTRSYLYEE